MPPDTGFYMLLAYGVLLGMLGLYVLSLLLRRRNALRDLETLRDLEDTEK
jgi:heme exporter protein D